MTTSEPRAAASPLFRAGYWLVLLSVLAIPLFSEAHLAFFGTSVVNLIEIPLVLTFFGSICTHPFIKKAFAPLCVLVSVEAVAYALAGTSGPWREYSDTAMVLAYLGRVIFVASFVWFVRTSSQLDRIMTAVIVGSVIVAVVSVLRWLHSFPFESIYVSLEYGVGERNMGTFIISGSYALWIGLGVAAMVTRIRDRRRGLVERVIYIGSIVICGFSAAVVARSRNAIMFLFIAAMASIYFPQSKRWRKRHALASLSVLIISAIVGSWVYEGLVSGAMILTARVTLIKASTEFILDYPIFGVGLGVFRDFLSPRLQPVHNAFLDLLVEAGIVGMLPFAALLLYVWVRLMRARSQLRRYEFVVPAFIATVASVQFFPAQLSYPLWLIIGIGLSVTVFPRWEAMTRGQNGAEGYRCHAVFE